MNTDTTTGFASNNKESRPMAIARSGRSQLLLALGLATVLALSLLAPVNAASHREAPLISQDAVADNTDTYAFVSPDNPRTSR